jgi:hypothetical protein
MHTIFVGGIATDKNGMGSDEPLGAPSPPLEYGIDSQESEIIIIDGPECTAHGGSSPPSLA